MSKIIFESKANKCNISGAERAHLGISIANIFVATFPKLISFNYPEERFWEMLPANHYLHKEYLRQKDNSGWLPNLEFQLNTWLRSTFSESLIISSSYEANVFYVSLNTALLYGSDPIKLAARIHGQCEVHGWIDNKNREWFAGLIQKSLLTGIFRQNEGWEELIEFLSDDLDSDIVMSYSITDTFGLLEGEWEDKIIKLKKEKSFNEIKPENFQDYYFGVGWDNLKISFLLNYDLKEREIIAKNYIDSDKHPYQAWQEAIKEYDFSRKMD